MKYQLATAHIAGIPLVIRGHALDLSQGSRECLVIYIDLLQSWFIATLVHMWLPSCPFGIQSPRAGRKRPRIDLHYCTYPTTTVRYRALRIIALR
jgi:hypothetical protein